MPRRRGRPRGGAGLAIALSSALAQQNLSLTLEDCAQGRQVVRLIKQPSVMLVAEDEDGEEDEEEDEDDEGEDGDDDEDDGDGPQNRVNTKFLSRMLTSLARTNKRVATASMKTDQNQLPPPRPLPRPKRSLAERRSRAELQIRRIAAACGLRVEIAVDDSFMEDEEADNSKEDEEAASATAAQPALTSDASATASGSKPAVARLLGAALQGAVAPRRPACGVSSESSAAQASCASAAPPTELAPLDLRNAIKAGAKALSGAKAPDADAAAELVKRRRVDAPALYVPPSRRPKG